MDSQQFDYDVIVIGSGFGGSVMTYRLAEKGYNVCLLERGRKYGMHEFPRRMDEVRDRLFWDPEDKKYGFMEFRVYPKSDALSVSASGLGGGSLIYANVLMRMPEDFFQGWPGGITRKTLDPFYDRALAMLEGAPYPFRDHPYYADTPKTAVMEAVSAKIKDDPDTLEPHKFLLPDLSIRFKGDFPGHQTLNSHGVIQSSCIKCGECDIGCNIHAKNTLDLNYLARAQNATFLPKGKPATIRTNSMVKDIEIDGDGYRITFIDPRAPEDRKSLRAKKVIVSAGCVGSNSLLLRMKKEGKLPKLSAQLGKKWCGNGDVEGTVLRAKVNVPITRGPVITSAIQYRFQDYPDGFKHGAVIQEAGIPSFLAWYIVGKMPSPDFWIRIFITPIRAIRYFFRRIGTLLGFTRFKKEINFGAEISELIDQDDYTRSTAVLLGMGRDRNDGEIILNEDDEPIIKWRKKNSSLHFKRVGREMRKVAKAMGGVFLDNPLTYLDKLIAVHPLGGCTMADSPENGVIAPNGEAFGHPGLYVVDASILPTSTGPNPSLTITAMAEYIASQFPDKN